MKQEANKTKKKWILPVVIAAAVLVVVSIVLAVIMIPWGQDAGSVQSKLYWNVDRTEHLDPESGLSSRPADADGLYTILFAVDGEQMSLRCADKRLVNAIDAMDLMGLVFDADGLIVEIISPENVATEMAKEFFVRSFDGKTLTLNSSMTMNGLAMTIPFTDNTTLYDMSAEAETVGQVGQTLGVMDKVSVYGTAEGEATHVFRATAAVDAEVYHRLYRKYDKVNKVSSRVPDENGVYTIEYAHRGQLVDLKCRDQALVNEIDQKYDAGAQMGLIFDDEGYIIKIITAGEAIRGQLLLKKHTVTAIEGNTVTFESKYYANSDIGMITTMTLPEGLEMYLIEAGCDAHFIGEATPELKLGDRCYVYTDFDNNPKMIFIERRMAEGKIGFNIERMYDTVKLETTRVPVNGYYVFKVALDGKQIEVKTNDKALASRVDSYSNRVVGLKLNGNIIEGVYDPACITGNGGMSNRFVTNVMSGILSIVSRDDWTAGSNKLLAPDVQIIDVTGNAKVPIGSFTELQPYDWILTTCLNENDQVTHVFIQQRYVEDSILVYNTDRQYDAEKKTTVRLPDANGYYVYSLATEGKTFTAKTKDKEIATFIDKNKRAVAVTVSGGIITAAYNPATCVKGGRVTLTGSTFVKMNDYGTTFDYIPYGGGEQTTCIYMFSENCSVYNVGVVFDRQRGEKTTLRQGDAIYMIFSYEDKQIKKMLVTGGRESNEPLYWHVNRQYNFTTLETAREPDADGWYVFEFAVDGQIKTFKTKDKLIATKADRRSGAFSIIRNGDIILDVITYPNTKEVDGTVAGGYTVTAINGRTVTAENLNASSATFGDVKKLKLISKPKIYNVSSYADPFGAAVELSVGDQITCYTDKNENVVYVYITAKNTRAAGFESYCEHCGKTVRWTALTGSIARANMHYYLPADKESNQIKLGYRAAELEADPTLKPFETVIDLNGMTFTAKNDRLFRLYSGTLTIMDTVGTGKMIAGLNGSDGGGLIRSSGTGVVVNLYGGTLTTAEGAGTHPRGAIFYGSYTLNMYGGTITGGVVEGTESQAKPGGGNIYISGGTLNMYGGTISDGSAMRNSFGTGRGGNVWALNSTVNMYGGTISGGETAGAGGNVYADGGKFNMYGGTIIGGVSGGTTDDVGLGATTEFNMSGGTITGEIQTGGDLTATFSGAPVISGKLTVGAGTRINLGALTNGASIDISAEGVFTGETANAANYVGYFHPMRESDTIGVTADGKALTYIKYAPDGNEIDNADLVFDAGTTNAMCPSCGQKVTWTALTADTNYACGGDEHYYLAEDITFEGTAAFVKGPAAGGESCVHLNGKTLVSKNSSAFAGGSGILNIMGNGTVTGYHKGAYNGGAIDLDTTGKAAYINVYGGTYYLADDTKSRPVAVGNHGGHINLYKDVTIIATSRARSALYLGSAVDNNSELNIYGATINGGYEIADATDITTYTNTTLIDGGNFTGSILVKGDSYVTLAGDISITNGMLDIAEGALVTVGELNVSNPIPVSAVGVFTTQMSDAAAYVGSFKASGNDTIEVTEDGKALKYVVAEVVVPPIENKVCAACGVAPADGWTPITMNSVEEITADGHYVLTRDWMEDSKAGTQLPAYNICLDLNGHTITSDATSSNALNGRAMTISGGNTVNIMGDGFVTPVGPQGAIYVTNGTVNIYGGTYTAATGGRVLYVTGATATINVSGGTYTGTLYTANEATLSITGGTFSVDPSTYVADGYAATDNGNGTWTVAASGGSEPQPETRTCAKCGDVANWTAITLNSTEEITADGHYYLDNDWEKSSKAGITVPVYNICLDLNGHSISGTSTNGRALTITGGQTVNIMGEGTVETTGTQGAFYVTNGTVNLYGGTYSAPDGEKVIYLTGATAAMNVQGGTYTGTLYVANEAALSITGGTFSVDPTAYVATGYEVTDNGNGTWTVTAVAAEPETKTCAACGEIPVSQWTAITENSAAEITADGHYYLDKDWEKSSKAGITIPAYNICLDLNGHSINGTSTNGRALTISNGTIVNIMGDGTVATTGTQGAIYCSDGTVNLYGGTFNAPAGEKVIYLAAATAAVNVQGGTYTGTLYVVDGANLKIYGGTFSVDPSAYVATDYAATDNGDGTWTVDVSTGDEPETRTCAKCGEVANWTAITVNSVDEITADGHYYLDKDWEKSGKAGITIPAFNICLDLNGHSISGTSTNGRAISVTNGNTVNIMGEGTVTTTGPQGAIYVSGGTVNVYSGTYSGPDGERVVHVTGATSTVNILGGTFTGVYNVTNEGTLSISGGTFSADPTAYVAEGYAATDNGNGTWTVAEKAFELDGNAVDNADLVFATGTTNAKCVVCNKEVTWTQVTTDADITVAGHYYVTDEIAVTDADGLKIATDGSVCLHLGSTAIISSDDTDTGKCAVTCSGGTLNVIGTGAIKGKTGSKNGGAGSILSTGKDVVVNLYGGKYTGNGGSYSAVSVSAEGTMKVYAGATISSGNLGVNGASTLEIHGGEISAYIRASSATQGVANIYGGNFTGTTYIFHGTKPATSVIYGGTFVLDPTAFVPATGYTVTLNEGVYTVAEA